MWGSDLEENWDNCRIKAKPWMVLQSPRDCWNFRQGTVTWNLQYNFLYRLWTSVCVLTSAYCQSSPITSVSALNKNDYIWHVLRLETISSITKWRKHFWMKVNFSKSTLCFVIRPMFSNRETHNILDNSFNNLLK